MIEKLKSKLPTGKQVISGVGIVTITSAIGLLSMIYVTKDAFSYWQIKDMEKEQAQNIQMTQNGERILSADKLLVRMEANQLKMEANQREMLKLLISRK